MRLSKLSFAEIERLPLQIGKREECVGDWFDVEATAGDDLIVAGPGRRLDRFGAGMRLGRIVVAGDAGAYLGLGLAGGEIRVEGSVGHGAATDMRDGTIRIEGDAGDEIGGALPGAASGMRGGTVVVFGRAGARCGYQLRRGLVVIVGDAGPVCGGRMAAGTILVGGRVQSNAGAAMRRGSLMALGGFDRLGPTFSDCGVHDLVVLRLLARLLVQSGLATLAERLGPMRRLLGDHAVGGKGELLIPS